MIKDRYLKKITEQVDEFSKNRDIEFFIFGSSLKKEHFGDVDLGVTGDIKDSEIGKLKESFDNSTLPYFVDVINFNEVSSNFKKNVFNNKVLWIKH